MRWNQSGIAEAVTLSKKTGAVFVVYVEGKDNVSQELTNLINNETISNELENEQHFVAIKIEENSLPHQQFVEIYKNVKVPSIYFIGKTGTPLEIVTAANTIEDFLSKLSSVLRSNGINAIAGLTTDFIKSEQAEGTSSVACVGDTSVIKSEDEPSTSQTIESEDELQLSSEEKVERAKALITQKREAKKAEEEEMQRLKELERRKLGQDVQKLKKWQQENELKELIDERNKEKREQQLARQRVLDQIAQDKAERAAKFASQNVQQPSQSVSQPVQRVVNTNTARLQFRLPNGTTHTHEFPSTSTLEEVCNYVKTNLDLPSHNFTLSTTFPRHEFTSSDCGESLLSLSLVPNAVILVLPLQHRAISANSTSWLMTVFWSFVGPILNFVGYLKNFVFGAPPPRQPSLPKPSSKRPSENTGESSKSGDPNIVRRQGNIHRLRDKNDSDDENNTWNGNSTQQM